MRALSRFAMVLAATLALAAVPRVAGAASFEAGTVEFGIDATLSHSSYTYEDQAVAKRDDISVTTGVGYCVTDLLELKGSLLFTYASANPEGGESASASAFGALGGLVVNFGSGGTMVPYVQGSVGVLSYSGDGYENSEATLVLPRLGAGVRFMVGESASINCGAFWQLLSNAEGVEELSANQFGLAVGTSLLF
jgi:hypothetical protein